MANKHILSLEVSPVSNCEILCIKDTSQYTSDLSIDCEELLITPPGFNSPSLIKVQHGFDLCLNSCALDIQQTNCGDHRSHVPDGIYIIRYSVSPTDKVYVEYNHLRVTSLLTKYYKVLCDIDMKPVNQVVKDLRSLLKWDILKLLLMLQLPK
ncbi:MAG: hypothetical protein CM15mV42_0320 [uncultured marine virus]|nr:MAG: hypothetical protein CM15mV42_0320 [uncultured marine virus]